MASGFESDRTPEPAGTGNTLLEALPGHERSFIASAMRTVVLPEGQILCSDDTDFAHAYFPAGSTIALVSVLPGGQAIETARVRNDGIIGAPLMKPGRSIVGSAVVTRGGVAYELDIPALSHELRREGVLRRLVFQYTRTLMQNAAGCYAVRLCQYFTGKNDRRVIALPPVERRAEGP